MIVFGFKGVRAVAISLAISFLTISFTPDACGQSAVRSFEVASVKPAPAAAAVSITPLRSGNRLTYITTLPLLLNYAFQVLPFQVSGNLPEGVYDIEATTEGSADEGQIRLMLQTLLADRFRLKLHREAKEMRVYELVVDKRGTQLKAAQEISEIMLDGRPAPPGVGLWGGRAGPQLVGKGASMAQLADCLARVLHEPVLDRTGLTGSFDFDIHYAIDDPQMPGASLTLAIRQQLGLKVLHSGKAPIDVLIIDHAEEPSGN